MITKPTKYKPEWILKELKQWLKEAKEDESIVFIKAFTEKRRYSYKEMKDAIDYNKGKSPLYSEIFETYERIKEILEHRVAKGALNNKYQSNIAQLFLKYNHNWIDKQTIDQKTTIEKKPDKELEEELAKDIANIS